MPNHLADLEETVAELEATVNGLRGELVDANERIRALERQLEDDTDTATSSTETELVSPPETEEHVEETTDTEQRRDDIIVA